MDYINKLSAQMLEQHSDDLSNKGCNDWDFPAWMTEQERDEFLVEYRHFHGEKNLPLFDWMVASFLANQLTRAM